MISHKRCLPVALLLAVLASPGRAAEPQPIPPGQFDQLQQMIKPQPGESRFWQIPWLLNLDEAIQKGATEGKPIFIWSGAGGSPHTVC
jgi:hypothetical protein